MTDLAAEHLRTDAVDSVSTRTHDEPFAVVGPFIAAVHLANYLFGPFVSLAGELGIMVVGAFIVHGVLAALEQDDLGTPPPPR